jgi:hypothetical protein
MLGAGRPLGRGVSAARIELTTRALRDLRKFGKPDRRRIAAALEELAERRHDVAAATLAGRPGAPTRDRASEVPVVKARLLLEPQIADPKLAGMHSNHPPRVFGWIRCPGVAHVGHEGHVAQSRECCDSLCSAHGRTGSGASALSITSTTSQLLGAGVAIWET